VAGVARPPFSVVIARFDPATRTIVAATLPNHPLFGWRYWRVLERFPGDIVVETGSLDLPSPLHDPVMNAIGFLGDWWVTGKQLKMWKEDLAYVLQTLAAEPLGAVQGTAIDPALLDGKWDRSKKDYIVDAICGPRPSGVAPFCR
jgi:hypothetical protein